jgi:hypothetical protein
MNVAPLKANSLRRVCDPLMFNFRDTSCLSPSRGLIGQQRAVEATEFALKIHVDGYNLYMAGESGEGKTRYALEIAQRYAKTMPVPDDWCYVYNFEDENRPKAINLPAGLGREFKKDMEEFISSIEHELSKAFDGEDYEIERSRVLREFREKKDMYIKEISSEAEKKGFKISSMSLIELICIIDFLSAHCNKSAI